MNLTWAEISTYFTDKNDKHCAYRYSKLINKFSSKWKKQEDNKLNELIEKYGENFNLIKEYLPDRTRSEIEIRFYQKINTKLISFSHIEDNLILEAYSGSFISSKFEQLLISKGIHSIKKRLDILMKLKGDLLYVNSKEYESFLNLIQRESNETEATTHQERHYIEEKSHFESNNNLSIVLDDNISIKTKTNKINYETDFNFNICNEPSKSCYNLEDDNDIFEKSFNIFDPSFYNLNLNEDDEMKLDFAETKHNSQVIALLEQQESLENILLKLEEISANMLNLIYEKDSNKKSRLDILITEEFQVKTKLEKSKLINISNMYNESDMKQELLIRLDIIHNLIQLNKEKINILSN